MNISFRKDDPKNSLVVDADTEQALYEIDTTRSISDETTTIRRMNDQLGVIAQVNWPWFGSEMVQVGSNLDWIKLKSFLSKDGLLSDSRVFVAPNGVKYKWKVVGNKCILSDCRTHAIVAESHRKKHGFLTGNSRPMNLDITPQVVEILDIVLLTFVIMEKNRRDTELAVVVNA